MQAWNVCSGLQAGVWLLRFICVSAAGICESRHPLLLRAVLAYLILTGAVGRGIKNHFSHNPAPGASPPARWDPRRVTDPTRPRSYTGPAGGRRPRISGSPRRDEGAAAAGPSLLRDRLGLLMRGRAWVLKQLATEGAGLLFWGVPGTASRCLRPVPEG